MAELVVRSLRDPVVQAFAATLRETAGEDGPAFELFSVLRASQVYTDDPSRTETIRDPVPHIRAIMAGSKFRGDCDDVAVIGASVLAALGYRVGFGVVNRGGKDRPYRHVFYVAQRSPDGAVVPFDPQVEKVGHPPTKVGEWPKWAKRKGIRWV